MSEEQSSALSMSHGNTLKKVGKILASTIAKEVVKGEREQVNWG